MNVISAEDLKRKIDQKDDFKLVNPLPAYKFQVMHIPGSINIAIAEDTDKNSMKHDIEKLLKIDDEIVVYCTDVACFASRFLYQQLENFGYKKIYRFSGGLNAWQAAGYTLIEGNIE